MFEEGGQYGWSAVIDRRLRGEGSMERRWVPSHLQWDVKGGFKQMVVECDLCFDRITLAASWGID